MATYSFFTELISSQQALGIANSKRIDQWVILRLELEDLKAEPKATGQLAEVYAGRLKAEEVKDGEREIADRVVKQFYTADEPFPDLQLVAHRKTQLKRGAVLINLVRRRVNAFDVEAGKRASAAEEFARNALLDVGTYYLELLTALQAESFERLAFLDAYYAAAQVILSFAVIRYVREQLPILWDNLQFVAGAVLGDIRVANGAPPVNRFAQAAIGRAIGLQNLVNNKDGMSVYGDLPRVARGLSEFPDGKLAAKLSANILRLQVEVPLVRLMDFR